MLDVARGYFRKTIFKTYRYFKHPRRLKKNALLRWFSLHFLDKHVWRPTQHTFAGGLAVGFFVMMQLVPGQMFFAVILAALLRVNIPIAIVACWITNPVTMVPAAIAQIALGNWLLEMMGHTTVPAPDFDSADKFVRFLWHWLIDGGTTRSVPPFGIETSLSWLKAMLLGGAAGGILLAGAGYICAFGLWGLFGRFWTRKHPTLIPPVKKAGIPGQAGPNSP